MATGALFALIFCVPVVDTALSPTHHQKKTVVSHGNALFNEPPPSLREVSLAADAVVHGRVLGGSAKAGGFYQPEDSGIITLSRFKILEILQTYGGRPIDAKEITVVHDGGTIDRGDRLQQLEIDNYPQFELGGSTSCSYSGIQNTRLG
jgi:hypothetical protein